MPIIDETTMLAMKKLGTSLISNIAASPAFNALLIHAKSTSKLSMRLPRGPKLPDL